MLSIGPDFRKISAMHSPRIRPSWLWLALLMLAGCASSGGRPENSSMNLHLRSQNGGASGVIVASERVESWDPHRTAIIVCDMWDDHWCKSASSRVGELIEPMNRTLEAARKRGVFIIHAPSSVTAFYQGTPARELALKARHTATPRPLATAERWGTRWCWPDASREGVLPIDDSDMGCSCSGSKCTVREAWTRQHPGLRIEAGDALTDDGQETWNLLAERGIDHVILCGVHLNMCVLGRPFAIRQMVRMGKQVALIRDLTDTMYNPERPPGVDHFTGTDRVVAHIERYWCPSFTSADITGGKPFRFREDRR
jgi:nicotinamidase-related amidase